MSTLSGRKLTSLLIVFAFVLTLCLSVFSMSAAADTSIDEDKALLESLTAQQAANSQQLKDLQAQIAANKNEEKTLLQEKSLLEQELNLLDTSIETNEALIDTYSFQIESNDIAIAELEQKLEEEMVIYGNVLRYYAQYGEISTFEILFSSKSFSDFLTRLDYIGLILEYNNTIVDDIRTTQNDIANAKAQNEKYLAECIALKAELNENKVTYTERTAELDELLQGLTEEALNTQEDIDRLQAEENKLLMSIEKLQEQIDNKESFTPSGDGYTWPFAANVTGSLYISSPFEWRINPVTNRQELHKGIDIPAPYGTPIQAVMGGTVIKSEYNAGGYGYYVVIYHGNGISTLYGHCSKLLVSVGATVLQNQVIARVGSTGQSTGNHLHISFLNGSTYLNPADYLPADMLNRINIRGYDLHQLESYTP